MSSIRVRNATVSDAAAIADIYNHYVLTSIATFEEDPLSVEQIADRIWSVASDGLPWIVAEDTALLDDLPPATPRDDPRRADAIVGYAYAHSFQERAAYRHSLETSTYVRDGERGRGVGNLLYGTLIERVRELKPADTVHAPVHRLYARLSVPNPASDAMQLRHGFQRVGLLDEAGYKLGQWVGVSFWELRLDD